MDKPATKIECREEWAAHGLRIHPNPEPRTPKPDSPRGFTLAELIIGLLLLAIIGGATAALASAIAQGWKAGDSNAASTLRINRTMLRIQDKIQRSRVLGQWFPGSLNPESTAQGAAVFFWRGDKNGDGQMQLDETEIIEHDPSKGTLVIWETTFPDPVTAAAFNGPFPTTMLNEPNAIANYKVMPHTKRHTITRGVPGAAFNVINPTTPTSRTQFEWRLRFTTPTGEAVEYGTASQRAPF